MKIKQLLCLLMAAIMVTAAMSGCANNNNESDNDKKEDLNMNTINSLSERVRVDAELGVSLKKLDEMNPLVSTRFSADPTSVEYNGRLYVFSTNDHQQYLATPYAINGFGDIHTLNVFSSADLVNWTDHGYIDVKAASPRITTSWAPSIVK